MSTKIYNGFRVNRGDALSNLNALNTVREKVQGLVDAKAAKVMAQRLVEAVDGYCIAHHELCLGPARSFSQQWAEKADKHVRWDLLEEVLKEQRECRAAATRSPDIDCDVTLFLRPDPQTGMLYGYLQEEGVGAHKALLRMPGFEDYAYWNNSEGPEDVSEQDWVRRKKDWYRIFDADVACLQLRFEPNLLSRDMLLAQVPSLEERSLQQAKKLLENLLYRSWSRRRIAKGMVAEERLSEVVGFLQRSRRFTQPTAGPLGQPLRSLSEHLKECLPRDFAECLSMKLQDIPATVS
jgi:hypothetical protein